jgi:periplasmic protein TonB
MNEQLDRSDSPQTAKPAPVRRAASPSLLARADEESFWDRHKIKLILGAVIVVCGSAVYFLKPGTGPKVQKAPERIVSIQLPPPPPPPPPPPKVRPPPPPEQKMVEQAPVETPEKPKDEPAKPKDEPPKEALGTGIKGDGAGLAGLGGSGNGGGFGGAKGGGGGSKWGWYASQVQARIAEALRRNGHTMNASLKVQVRIWADSTGRITRASLDAGSGDPKLDAAIQNEVLTGLQLTEPPPPGLPMPIVMRLTARRP